MQLSKGKGTKKEKYVNEKIKNIFLIFECL